MQEKYLNRKTAQELLDTRPAGTDVNSALSVLAKRGFIIEGYNDKPKETENKGPLQDSFVGKMAGELARPVEGLAKTLETYGGGTAAYVADKLTPDSMTGGKNVYSSYGDAISGAKQKANNELNAVGYLTGQNTKAADTGKEALGQALGTASLVVPVGEGAKAATTLAKVTKLGATGASAGAMSGAGNTLAEGGSVKDAIANGITGAAIGAAVPVAMKGVGSAIGAIKKGMNISSDMLNNSIIKPGAKEFKYGKNPGETMAKYGITGSTLEEISQNALQAKQKVGQDMQNIVDEFSNLSEKSVNSSKVSKGLQEQSSQLKSKIGSSYNLNLNDTFSEIDDGIKQSITRKNTTLANKLQDIKEALTSNLEAVIDPQTGRYIEKNVGKRNLNNLSFKEAWNLRKEIDSFINYTADTTDDMKVNGIVKNLRDAVNTKIDSFAKEADPELFKRWKDLNIDYGGLENVRAAAERRGLVMQKQNLTGGLQTPAFTIAGGIGSAGVSSLLGGDPETSGAVGAGASLAVAALSKNPKVMSTIATKLYKKEAANIISKSTSLSALKTALSKASPIVKNLIIQELTKGAKSE